MEKTYKSESRVIKRMALAARLTFRQRKILLDLQPFLVAILMMTMNGWIVIEQITGNKIVAWFAISLLSIPMYLLIIFMLSTIPKFNTLEEYIEHEIGKYLEEHAWRNIYMLMKKHKFPIIIDNALQNILYKKIKKMKTKSEILELITADGLFIYDEKDNALKIKRV